MFLFVGTAVREMTEARKRFLVHWRPYVQICIGLPRSVGRVLCVLSGRLTRSDHLTRRVKRVSNRCELGVKANSLTVDASLIQACFQELNHPVRARKLARWTAKYGRFADASLFGVYRSMSRMRFASPHLSQFPRKIALQK